MQEKIQKGNEYIDATIHEHSYEYDISFQYVWFGFFV